MQNCVVRTNPVGAQNARVAFSFHVDTCIFPRDKTGLTMVIIIQPLLFFVVNLAFSSEAKRLHESKHFTVEHLSNDYTYAKHYSYYYMRRIFYYLICEALSVYYYYFYSFHALNIVTTIFFIL